MGSGTKRYWGTQRVAQMCQVTPATVANWIDQGHLKGTKTPTGHRRVTSQDLVDFLQRHEIPVPPELAENVPRERVVLVEDDANFRRAFARLVERAGLDVELVEAATGMDGLLEIGRAEPALVLLDYALPDLNAVQVVERLLSPARGLDVEVMVVTGGLPAEAEERLRQLGVRTIVQKSDGMHVIIDAMQNALQRRRGRAA
jgi:CheY-like chemotaxis protein